MLDSTDKQEKEGEEQKMDVKCRKRKWGTERGNGVHRQLDWEELGVSRT